MYTLGSRHQESSPSVVNSIKFAKLSASQTILYTDEPYDKVLKQKKFMYFTFTYYCCSTRNLNSKFPLYSESLIYFSKRI